MTKLYRIIGVFPAHLFAERKYCICFECKSTEMHFIDSIFHLILVNKYTISHLPVPANLGLEQYTNIFKFHLLQRRNNSKYLWSDKSRLATHKIGSVNRRIAALH